MPQETVAVARDRDRCVRTANVRSENNNATTTTTVRDGNRAGENEEKTPRKTVLDRGGYCDGKQSRSQ